MLGLPLSGLLLGVDWFGLPGWRWILILEGFAPVLAGIATLFLLTATTFGEAEYRGWMASGDG